MWKAPGPSPQPRATFLSRKQKCSLAAVHLVLHSRAAARVQAGSPALRGARLGHWGERPRPWRRLVRPPGDLPGLKGGHKASDRGHSGPRRGRIGLRRRFKRRPRTDFYAHEAPMAPLEGPVGRTGGPRGRETHKRLPACSENEHAGSRKAHEPASAS